MNHCMAVTTKRDQVFNWVYFVFSPPFVKRELDDGPQYIPFLTHHILFQNQNRKFGKLLHSEKYMLPD